MSSLGILSAPNKILKVGQDRSPEVHGSIGSCKSDIFPFDKVCPQLSCVRRCLPPPETDCLRFSSTSNKMFNFMPFNLV